MKLPIILCASMLLVAACAKPSPAGTYKFDALAPGADAALPGAANCSMVLTKEKSATFSCGPVVLLDATWEMDGDTVTFSKGQGLLGTEYKLKDGNLIPQVKGADDTRWRFTRK
jgi:hypothetical protein